MLPHQSLRLDAEGELSCPRCTGTYLHHFRVEVFSRREDAPRGIHACVHSGDAFAPQDTLPDSVVVDDDMTGNPSRRRHGLLIHFLCEQCGPADLVLAVEQHKGSTSCRWLEGKQL